MKRTQRLDVGMVWLYHGPCAPSAEVVGTIRRWTDVYGYGPQDGGVKLWQAEGDIAEPDTPVGGYLWRELDWIWAPLHLSPLRRYMLGVMETVQEEMTPMQLLGGCVGWDHVRLFQRLGVRKHAERLVSQVVGAMMDGLHRAWRARCTLVQGAISEEEKMETSERVKVRKSRSRQAAMRILQTSLQPAPSS